MLRNITTPLKPEKYLRNNELLSAIPVTYLHKILDYLCY